MERSKFEELFEEYHKENYPEYYGGLQLIISEFEEYLIELNILKSANSQGYIELLQSVRETNNGKFNLEQNFNEKVREIAHLRKGNEEKGFSDKERASLSAFVFNKSVIKPLAIKFEDHYDNPESKPKEVAAILLDTLEPEDYDFQLVKSNIFGLLNSDFKPKRLYKLIGRPSSNKNVP